MDDDKTLWQLLHCPVYCHVSSSTDFQYPSTTVPKDDVCQVMCISLYTYTATATGKQVNVVVTRVIDGTDLYNYCY